MPGDILPRNSIQNRWILLVGIVEVVLLVSGCAKTPKVYRVGVLIGAATMATIADDFKARMTELGYVEGTNIAYDVQQIKVDPAEAKLIAGKFVTEKVDLVFAFPGQPAVAVKAVVQGTDIPIVFANAVIEGTGLVDSVRSPGGNITGVRLPSPELTLKSFESLLELTPRAKRVMVFYEPNYPTDPSVLEALRSAALSSNVTLQEVRILNVPDIPAILQALEKSGDTRINAILLFPGSDPSIVGSCQLGPEVRGCSSGSRCRRPANPGTKWGRSYRFDRPA